jgi:hypothetical protein
LTKRDGARDIRATPLPERAMQPTKSIASLAVSVLVLSGWGTSRAPQEGDACTLLNSSQVSAALGATVEAGKPVVASNPQLCGWAPSGGPQIGGKKLTVQLLTAKSFDMGKTPVNNVVKAPLSGVGDDAIYIISPRGLGTSLNVKKGNSAFQVRVGGFTTEQEKEIEKSLALEILKKL